MYIGYKMQIKCIKQVMIAGVILTCMAIPSGLFPEVPADASGGRDLTESEASTAMNLVYQGKTQAAMTWLEFSTPAAPPAAPRA